MKAEFGVLCLSWILSTNVNHHYHSVICFVQKASQDQPTRDRAANRKQPESEQFWTTDSCVFFARAITTIRALTPLWRSRWQSWLVGSISSSTVLESPDWYCKTEININKMQDQQTGNFIDRRTNIVLLAFQEARLTVSCFECGMAFLKTTF